MQIRSLVGNVLVAAGRDHLIGHDAGAVQQVEGLPGRQIGVDVEQRDLAHDRPVCKAKAVQEPTSPPPPMMLTFMDRLLA